MEKNKDIDVMMWLREVCDENYKKSGHLPTDEYIKKASEEGEQTELAKRLREKSKNENAKKKKH